MSGQTWKFEKAVIFFSCKSGLKIGYLYLADYGSTEHGLEDHVISTWERDYSYAKTLNEFYFICR